MYCASIEPAHPTHLAHPAHTGSVRQARSSIEVRIARSAADYRAAYALRYRVYVEELQFPQAYADHRRRIVTDPFDTTAKLLIATADDVVIGTVRTNFGKDCDLGSFADLHRMRELGSAFPSKVSLTTKLIVDPRFRDGRVYLELGHALFRIGRSHGIAVDFIDCQPKLIPLYRRFGYAQTSEQPFEHPELGPRMPMRLFTDRAYLQSVGSILLRRAE